MMPGDLAPMVISLTAIIAVAAVILLFPLSRKLGGFLEALTVERTRRSADPAPAISELRNEVSLMNSRIAELEDRLQFAEALLQPSERRALASQANSRGAVAPAGADRETVE